MKKSITGWSDAFIWVMEGHDSSVVSAGLSRVTATPSHSSSKCAHAPF